MKIHQKTINGMIFKYAVFGCGELVSIFACIDDGKEFYVDEDGFPFDQDELTYIENHIMRIRASKEVAINH